MRRIALDEVMDVMAGSIVRVVGSLQRTITYPASIREASSEEAITFCNKTGGEA
jgi:hypothetical protein